MTNLIRCCGLEDRRSNPGETPRDPPMPHRLSAAADYDCLMQGNLARVFHERDARKLIEATDVAHIRDTPTQSLHVFIETTVSTSLSDT